MATAQTVAYADASTYGTFSVWAQFLTTAFTTFGWTQTADYGQVNWTNLATSNVVPVSSSNVTWTSSVAGAAISGTFAASGGSLTIPIAVTTGMFPGKAVQLTALSGPASAYDGYMFTITSVTASTNIVVACPVSFSFSYATTTGTATIQPAFEIFVSTDTLSLSDPIYVKLEMYSGVSNASSMRITVGTGGTNGFGSLVAPTTTPATATGATADTTNLRPCYASGDAGSFRFVILMPIGLASPDTAQGLWFVVSRSRDNSGNATGSYVMNWVGSLSGGIVTAAAVCTFQTVFNAATGGTNVVDATGKLMAALADQTTGAVSGTTMVSPVFQNVGGVSNPTPDLLVGFVKDFPNNTPATISVYGVNHNYIAFGPTTQGLFAGAAATNTVSPLVRFE